MRNKGALETTKGKKEGKFKEFLPSHKEPLETLHYEILQGRASYWHKMIRSL